MVDYVTARRKELSRQGYQTKSSSGSSSRSSGGSSGKSKAQRQKEAIDKAFKELQAKGVSSADLERARSKVSSRTGSSAAEIEATVKASQAERLKESGVSQEQIDQFYSKEVKGRAATGTEVSKLLESWEKYGAEATKQAILRNDAEAARIEKEVMAQERSGRINVQDVKSYASDKLDELSQRAQDVKTIDEGKAILEEQKRVLEMAKKNINENRLSKEERSNIDNELSSINADLESINRTEKNRNQRQSDILAVQRKQEKLSSLNRLSGNDMASLSLTAASGGVNLAPFQSILDRERVKETQELKKITEEARARALQRQDVKASDIIDPNDESYTQARLQGVAEDDQLINMYSSNVDILEQAPTVEEYDIERKKQLEDIKTQSGHVLESDAYNDPYKDVKTGAGTIMGETFRSAWNNVAGIYNPVTETSNKFLGTNISNMTVIPAREKYVGDEERARVQALNLSTREQITKEYPTQIVDGVKVYKKTGEPVDKIINKPQSNYIQAEPMDNILVSGAKSLFRGFVDPVETLSPEYQTSMGTSDSFRDKVTYTASTAGAFFGIRLASSGAGAGKSALKASASTVAKVENVALKGLSAGYNVASKSARYGSYRALKNIPKALKDPLFRTGDIISRTSSKLAYPTARIVTSAATIATKVPGVSTIANMGRIGGKVAYSTGIIGAYGVGGYFATRTALNTGKDIFSSSDSREFRDKYNDEILKASVIYEDELQKRNRQGSNNIAANFAGSVIPGVSEFRAGSGERALAQGSVAQYARSQGLSEKDVRRLTKEAVSRYRIERGSEATGFLTGSIASETVGSAFVNKALRSKFGSNLVVDSLKSRVVTGSNIAVTSGRQIFYAGVGEGSTLYGVSQLSRGKEVTPGGVITYGLLGGIGAGVIGGGVVGLSAVSRGASKSALNTIYTVDPVFEQSADIFSDTLTAQRKSLGRRVPDEFSIGTPFGPQRPTFTQGVSRSVRNLRTGVKTRVSTSINNFANTVQNAKTRVSELGSIFSPNQANVNSLVNINVAAATSANVLTTTQTPIQSPVGIFTNTPTNTNTQTNTPNETPTEVPINIPINTPTNTPTNTPVNVPVNVPINTPTIPFGALFGAGVPGSKGAKGRAGKRGGFQYAASLSGMLVGAKATKSQKRQKVFTGFEVRGV